MKSVSLLAVLLTVSSSLVSAKLKEGECEVCLGVLGKMNSLLVDDPKKGDVQHIETVFKKFCKDTKIQKERSFCYNLGGLEESATGTLKDLSRPLSVPLPPEKICEKLRKADSQICELKYDKQIDLNKTDIKKLKVKDLKKILNDWDETCDGCIEKSDYISRIEELKPKYYKSSKTEL